MVTIKGHNFITQVDDMTVEQFSKATAIFNDETKLNVEKYLDVIEALGAPSEIVDELTNDELFQIIKSFSAEPAVFDNHYSLPRTIEINGWGYEAFTEGEEFKIKARDLALIEKAVNNKEDFYQTLLSILFKDPNLVNETYKKSHLDYKKSLFSKLPAKPYLGYLTEVSKTLTEKISNAFKTAQETT